MTISIKAPTRLLNDSTSTWYNSGWQTLDVDRIDQSVLCDVKIYNQNNEKTSINQLTSGKLQAIITGHINDDSGLVGTGTFEKTKNLILAARSWYYRLSAGATGLAQLDINGNEYDCLIQKVGVIDTAAIGDVLINYQLGLILKYGG